MVGKRKGLIINEGKQRTIAININFNNEFQSWLTAFVRERYNSIEFLQKLLAVN